MTVFNFTGRLDLTEQEITIIVSPGENSPEFELTISEETLAEFDPDSHIIVETFLGFEGERFDFGTVSEPQFASKRQLTRFRNDDEFAFRVKIVDTKSTPGQLLGFARRIVPKYSDEGNVSSLLGVKIEQLDDVVYRLEFPDDGAPLLILNESIDEQLEQGLKSVARSHPLFVSLVYPSVVREILLRIFLVNRSGEPDENDAPWINKWKAFAKAKNPEAIPDWEDGDYSQRVDWIERVVESLGKDLNAVRIFENSVRESI